MQLESDIQVAARCLLKPQNHSTPPSLPKKLQTDLYRFLGVGFQSQCSFQVLIFQRQHYSYGKSTSGIAFMQPFLLVNLSVVS